MHLERAILICAATVSLMAGCSQKPPAPDPRDQALKDPMNYNPAQGDMGPSQPNGLLDFDKKAFDRDVNNVLNP